jgi:hypothetical protein
MEAALARASAENLENGADSQAPPLPRRARDEHQPYEHQAGLACPLPKLEGTRGGRVREPGDVRSTGTAPFWEELRNEQCCLGGADVLWVSSRG